MAYFAPKRRERRGMAIRAEPKPVTVLMSMEAKMIRKAKANSSIMVYSELPRFKVIIFSSVHKSLSTLIFCKGNVLPFAFGIS